MLLSIRKIISILFILDSDECILSTTCDVNAQCTNLPSVFSFQCKCNEGYEGNGFTCDKIAEKETVFENECKIFLFKVSLCYVLDPVGRVGSVFLCVRTLVDHNFYLPGQNVFLWFETFSPGSNFSSIGSKTFLKCEKLLLSFFSCLIFYQRSKFSFQIIAWKKITILFKRRVLIIL